MSAPTIAHELADNLEELTRMTRELRADKWRETMVPMTSERNGR